MADVRMIDANALLKEFEKRQEQQTNEYCDCFLNDAQELSTEWWCVEDAVTAAPTIDAVPVVRCWECEKFWEYTESHKATVEKADGDCMIRCMVAPDDPQFCAVQKDDYCSMGKRKGAKMDAKEG